jgi:hypothetical protein
MTEAYHNPALYKAMKSYVSAAIELVATRVVRECPSDTNDDTFFYARLAATDELTKLPEYQMCSAALTGDSVISSQIDTLAGTNSGRRSRTQSAEGLMRSVLDLGIGDSDEVFDETHFEREYERFEEAYYCPEIAYEVIAPLPGVAISHSWRLAEDLEITNLPMETLNRLARDKRSRMSGDPFGNNVCVIRSECRLPKVVGDAREHSLREREKDQAKQSAVNDRIEQVVNALRLCGIENAYSSAIIHRTSQWAFDQDRFFPGRFQPDFFYVNSLEDKWLESFALFWQSFQSHGVKGRKFLEVAIRRFGYAHERQRIEDRIIDLMISAEALFLADYNKDSYFGEIRYRLSMRAALFLANEGEAQKTIFRWMKDAYDLRSKLAHGGDSHRTKLPKHLDGSDVTLDGFVGAIQTYIRIALVKAINIAKEPTAPVNLVEWDELVFSNKNNDRSG